MKHLVLCIAIVAMAILVAAPAIAERQGGGGECQRGERQGCGPGGPGQGQSGLGEGFRRGPQGGRCGHGQGGPSQFIERLLEGETAEKLELKPNQIKTLKKGIQKLEKQEEKLRDKLQAAGKEQAELLQTEGEVDEVALMKAIEKTGKIRTQMAKLRMQPILLVKKTLTPEQLQTSRKMMRERMNARRGKRDEHREKMEARRQERQECTDRRQDDDE